MKLVALAGMNKAVYNPKALQEAFWTFKEYILVQ